MKLPALGSGTISAGQLDEMFIAIVFIFNADASDSKTERLMLGILRKLQCLTITTNNPDNASVVYKMHLEPSRICPLN